MSTHIHPPGTPQPGAIASVSPHADTPRSALADDVVLSAAPNERELLEALLGEMHRQDFKHGPFQGSRIGRSRLALACLEDEVREALQAWRDERQAGGWEESRLEVLQVAAVAMRALRDALTNGDQAERGASNLVDGGQS